MKCKKKTIEYERFFPIEEDPFVEDADYCIREPQEGYWTARKPKEQTPNEQRNKMETEKSFRDYNFHSRNRINMSTSGAVLREKLEQKLRR